MTRRGWRIIWRALRLRCLACGGSPVFLSWFREAPSCPRCGFQLDRAEDGYWLGSYSTNLSVTLFLVAVGVGVAAAIMWPTPNWTAITIGSVIAGIALPIAIFPWTKTFYLALDFWFRPPEEHDFNEPIEPRMRKRQTGRES